MINKKAIALGVSILAISTSSIYADTKVTENKLVGADRYKTAIEVSKAGWSSSSKAVLVQGDALVDALTSTPLAEEYNAPILLTEKNNLNAETLKELKRLGVKEVTIIGSEGVVSKSQESTLKSNGINVQRIGGGDRYTTSIKIAEKLKSIYQSKGYSERKVAFVVNGVKGLADSVSSASPASIKNGYILYSNGTNLNGIKSFIQSSVDDVYIIGGTSAISQGVENELKNSTNKAIYRLAGIDRNDTNAKVIDKFFTKKDINNMYIAKDGMGKESELVDALSVGVLAGRESNPVMLSSNNLGNTQKALLQNKNVKAVTQVGNGKNSAPYQQAVSLVMGMSTGGGDSTTQDGIKIPKINYAKEQNIKITTSHGQPIGGNPMAGAKIEGTLYVKYGDGDGLGGHSYGSRTQNEYDKSMTWVKDKLKSLNLRYQADFVYLDYYLKGGKEANFVDPILKAQGKGMDYGSWKSINKNLIVGLENGIVSKEDAEQISIYNSAVSHVRSFLPRLTDTGDSRPVSAFDVIYLNISDCDSSANFDSLVGDIIGMNTMVSGTKTHQDVMVTTTNGTYFWVNGRTPTIKKTTNPFTHYEVVISSPTYNLESFYK